MSKYRACPCGVSSNQKTCVCRDDVPIQEFDTEEMAIAEANRLQASWDAMVTQIEEQTERLLELNTRQGSYSGLVKKADEIHALQHIGRAEYVIHFQRALSQPLITGSSANITYRNHRGTAEVKHEHQRNIGRGGR